MKRVAMIGLVLATTAAPVFAQPTSPSAAGESSHSARVDATPIARKQEMQIEFRILETGGSISFAPKNSSDTRSRESLRSFGNRLSQQLKAADLSSLVDLFPEAAQQLARLKSTDGVSMNVEQLPDRFNLLLTASNQASRTAIHAFIGVARGNRILTPQERATNHPGNNLGWDAQKSSDIDK